jgi:uncharacterized membrane protein YecN with MAPEG domain
MGMGAAMIFPAITAFYASILGLIFAVLSAWVIAGRFKLQILHGDGGVDAMNRRMRAHGNFAEYVPLTLLLLGLLEASGGSRTIVRVLLIVLTVARAIHPFGMMAPPNSVQQYAFRATSVIATLTILGVAAILLLLRT